MPTSPGYFSASVLASETTMVTAGRELVYCPSVTETLTFGYEPTWLAFGVPPMRPMLGLKLAQAGRFCTRKVSVLPSGSLALGLHQYAAPAVALVAMAPLMIGGRLAVWAAASEAANAHSRIAATPAVRRVKCMDMNEPLPMASMSGAHLRGSRGIAQTVSEISLAS